MKGVIKLVKENYSFLGSEEDYALYLSCGDHKMQMEQERRILFYRLTSDQLYFQKKKKDEFETSFKEFVKNDNVSKILKIIIFQNLTLYSSDWSKFSFYKKEILVCVKYLQAGVEQKFLLNSDASFAEVVSRFTELVPAGDNCDYCVYPYSPLEPSRIPFSPVTKITERAVIKKGTVCKFQKYLYYFIIYIFIVHFGN